MIVQAVAGYELGRLLEIRGLLPKECTNIRLEIPADGTLQLHFTVNVLLEDLPKFADAFLQLYKDAGQSLRTQGDPPPDSSADVDAHPWKQPEDQNEH